MPDASLYSVGQRQRRMPINASYNTYYDCIFVCVCVCMYACVIHVRVDVYPFSYNRVLIYIVTFGKMRNA